MPGGVGNLWFAVALLAILLTTVVIALLTRKPPYVCPPGYSVAATVKPHDEAGRVLVTLERAGIDTRVVEETAKPFWRRLPFLLYTWYRPHEPSGPWHVVVPTAALAEATRLLSASTSRPGPADAPPA